LFTLMGLRTAWRARIQQWEREAEEAEAAAERAAAAAHAAASAEALAAFEQVQVAMAEGRRVGEEQHLNEVIPESLPTIGPAILALLRRESIETRRDLLNRTYESLQGVHGIGPGRAALLLEWAAKARYSSPFIKEEWNATTGASFNAPRPWLSLRRVHPLVALVANALASTAVLLGLAVVFFGSLPVSENIIVGLLFVVSGGLLVTPWWKTRMLGFGARFGLIALSVGVAAVALAVIGTLNRH
jgi:hypothetical protein